MKLIYQEPDLEERLTKPEYPYDSKEEAAIAQMLNDYGIPFSYKQPTIVMEDGQKTIEYVDFFLPTYNGLAIDYVIEPKSKIYLHKEEVYKQNKIPAVSLTPQDLNGKNWQSRLYKNLERIYHRRPVYSSSGRYK